MERRIRTLREFRIQCSFDIIKIGVGNFIVVGNAVESRIKRMLHAYFFVVMFKNTWWSFWRE